MDNSDFAGWVNEQLKVRQWSEADLITKARERGYRIETSHLNRVLSGERPGGVRAVIAIAHGLGISREEAFQARGWLLPSVDDAEAAILEGVSQRSDDPRLLEFLKTFFQLPARVQSALLESLMATLRTAQIALDETVEEKEDVNDS